uniref:pyruvate decarboxylase n=1 Tax=Vitis vinifera TaxID=29760 RepID=F6I6K4_VITVI
MRKGVLQPVDISAKFIKRKPLGIEAKHASVAPTIDIASSEATLGSHLARRLVQIGVSDVFSIPGDFNLTLLDHLIAELGLNNIGCWSLTQQLWSQSFWQRSSGVLWEAIQLDSMLMGAGGFFSPPHFKP